MPASYRHMVKIAREEAESEPLELIQQRRIQAYYARGGLNHAFLSS